MKVRRQPVREKHHEGFWFNGVWIDPDTAHRMCKEMMDRIDKLPKHVREYIHEHGRPPDSYEE